MMIFALSTFWSFSYAANEVDTTELLVNENKTIVREKKNIHVELNEENIKNKENTENEERHISTVESVFFNEGVDIGDSQDKLYEVVGEPTEEGMYEGGIFADYGHTTFFMNPESKIINAIAIPAEEIKQETLAEIEASLQDHLIEESFNEMDNLWMELYNWNEYDIMIERIDEVSPPFYIWLTEDGLFTK